MGDTSLTQQWGFGCFLVEKNHIFVNSFSKMKKKCNMGQLFKGGDMFPAPLSSGILGLYCLGKSIFCARFKAWMVGASCELSINVCAWFCLNWYFKIFSSNGGHCASGGHVPHSVVGQAHHPWDIMSPIKISKIRGVIPFETVPLSNNVVGLWWTADDVCIWWYVWVGNPN